MKKPKRTVLEWGDEQGLTADAAIARLERENNVMLSAIIEFCEHQRWADDLWKDQEHIKPLFDIAKKALDKTGKV